jgi:hypothetical protein
MEPFRDPDPFQEIACPTVIAANLAMPLAKLPRDAMDKLARGIRHRGCP